MGDTRATVHMSMVHSGFKTTTKGKVKTCFAVDGDAVEMEQLGEWRGRHCVMTEKVQFDNEGNTVILSKVLHIPSLKNNLFSITAEMVRGAERMNRGKVSVLKMSDLNEIGLTI